MYRNHFYFSIGEVSQTLYLDFLTDEGVRAQSTLWSMKYVEKQAGISKVLFRVQQTSTLLNGRSFHSDCLKGVFLWKKKKAWLSTYILIEYKSKC